MWDHPFHRLLPLPHLCCFTTTATLCPLQPCSPSPPLQHVWMNVSSLNPWLLDFHTIRFSVVLVVFRLVVILMVVQGGTACLPMPKSWPEVSPFIFNGSSFLSFDFHPLPQITYSTRATSIFYLKRIKQFKSQDFINRLK